MYNLVLLAYIPAAFIFFARPQRDWGVILYVLIGQLFLPEVHPNQSAGDFVEPFQLPLLVFSKPNCMAFGLLLAGFSTDARRLLAFRPTLVDAPIILLCGVPLLSGPVNGTTPNDWFAEFRQAVFTYGVPYFFGRVYLAEPISLRRLVAAITLGGVVYILPCLYEIRLAAPLHRSIYGFMQHDYGQHLRFGGFRPLVFMQHGIAVGLWMVSACLAGGWLWLCGWWGDLELPAIIRKWPRLTLVALAVTTVLVKSSGALALGLLGGLALAAARWLRTRIPLLAMIAVVPLFIGVRAGGLWHGEGLLDAVGQGVEKDRADSLEFRIKSEDKVMVHVAKSPLFGWGGGDRARIFDENGKPVVTDGMWIIMLANYGGLGATAFFGMPLLPALLFALRHRPADWHQDWLAPAAVASVILVAFALDCLLNAMLNPIWFLLAGSLTGMNELVRKYVAQSVAQAPAPHNTHGR